MKSNNIFRVLALVAAIPEISVLDKFCITCGKYISESKFCDAILVTKKRFDYVSDNKTSDSKLQSRAKEWENLAKKIDIDCQKERWPEKEKNYKEIISNAKFRVDLSEKITVQMKISPPKKDSWYRSCVRELKITNNSDFFIHVIPPKHTYHNKKNKQSKIIFLD